MPSAHDQSGSQVRVLTERENGRGWAFVVLVPRAGAGSEAAEHELTLSWADCEFWGHGVHSASRVAEAVLRALAELEPERELPARFDASTARRWVKGLDEKVREGL